MHPLRISKEATSLDLFDAAQARHSAACDALRLLAGAPDLGCPDEGTLAGTLGSLELLLRDASRLYEAARERA
ncbi:hypothetical protein [Pseudomonas citronellolis]|uniref:hypothetical protein n=1 Tax=Pseudomonas citronellolis TaxID=53408 RepID=UPI002D7754E2|nr:hypothetical protein [Pseudomonas citronellolis]WRT83353.1 hypothetical protein VK748_02725 [Pseudomonas citronellolis]